MGYAISLYSGRDKFAGFLCSLAAHAGLLLLGGAVLIKPAEFSVDSGFAGFEVELVAGTPEVVAVKPPVPEPVEDIVKEIPPPVEEKPTIVEEIRKVSEQILAQQQPKDEISKVEVAPKIIQAEKGNAPVNAIQSQKALNANASYFRNPAPYYPLEARQKGWEGLVVLEALVDSAGSVRELKVLRSSDHSVLDAAAMKAVKNWRFNPAKMGSASIESLVQIPIRFYLEAF